MPEQWSVDWKGDAVKGYVLQSVMAAFNETVSRALEDASVLKKNGGRMPYEIGTLSRSLKWEGSGAAKDMQGDISIRWGSFDVNYAKVQEDKNGFLRGAADKEYPDILPRIAGQFKRIAPQDAGL